MKDKPNYSDVEKYLIKKFMGAQGGLTPRNISFELDENYEFKIVNRFGRECISIVRKTGNGTRDSKDTD